MEKTKTTKASSTHRASTAIGFQPRRRHLDQEMPHLRKKYHGGIWGYGQKSASMFRTFNKNDKDTGVDVKSNQNATKILLSHTKKNSMDFSFKDLNKGEEKMQSTTPIKPNMNIQEQQ